MDTDAAVAALRADVQTVEVVGQEGMYAEGLEGLARTLDSCQLGVEPLFDVVHHAVVLREGAHVPVFGRGGIALAHPVSIAGAIGLVGHLPYDIVVGIFGQRHEDGFQGNLARLDFVAVGADALCQYVGHALFVAFGHQAVVQWHGLFALSASAACNAGVGGCGTVVEPLVKGALDVGGPVAVGSSISGSAQLGSHLCHGAEQMVVRGSLGEFGGHQGRYARRLLSPVAEYAEGVVDDVVRGVGRIVVEQPPHLWIVLAHERRVAVVVPVAVGHEYGRSAPVHVVAVDVHVVGGHTGHVAVGLLCVEAVEDHLFVERLHGKVHVERGVHLVGHVEPAQLLAVGAVGDAVVELRGNGIAADDVDVVDEWIGSR